MKKASKATKYPDAIMYKCPIQGIVFFAEMCGERRYKTAKEAQAACDLARKQREEAVWFSRFNSPNRIEACFESCVLKRVESGELAETIQCRDKYHFRSMLGQLSGTHPVFFYEKPSDTRSLENQGN